MLREDGAKESNAANVIENGRRVASNPVGRRSRSVDVSFASADEAKKNLRLFKALVQDLKGARDRALLMADEEHLAATEANGSSANGHKSQTSIKFGV